MTLTYGTSVGGWRELLVGRVQRVPIRASPAEAKQMQDARRAEAAWRRVRACLCVPLCLHTRPAGTLPGGYRVKQEAAKTRASEPAGVSSRGVLKNQAVHSLPETGLYIHFFLLHWTLSYRS